MVSFDCGEQEVYSSTDSAENEGEEESEEELDVAEELTDAKLGGYNSDEDHDYEASMVEKRAAEQEELEEEEEMEVLLELEARRGTVYTCPMVMSPLCDMDPIGLPEMMSGAAIEHLTSEHGLGQQEITAPRYHFAKWAAPEGEAVEELPEAEARLSEAALPDFLAGVAAEEPLRRGLLRGQGSAGAEEVLSADTQDMARMLRMVAAEAPGLEGAELAVSCSAASLGAMLNLVVEQGVSCGGTDMAAMLEGVDMGASCGGMQGMLEGVEMGASCSVADLNKLLGEKAGVEGVEMGASCGGADM